MSLVDPAGTDFPGQMNSGWAELPMIWVKGRGGRAHMSRRQKGTKPTHRDAAAWEADLRQPRAARGACQRRVNRVMATAATTGVATIRSDKT